jgi:phosphotransferase system  glucose/maltose/N-acetylglucosamine-specific IIC component
MKEQQDTDQQNKIFDNSDTKKLFQKGLKFLALALPLLFASPILITIGFKALNKGDGYLILVLGCLLSIFTIALVTQAFRLILKALFNR